MLLCILTPLKKRMILGQHRQKRRMLVLHPSSWTFPSLFSFLSPFYSLPKLVRALLKAVQAHFNGKDVISQDISIFILTIAMFTKSQKKYRRRMYANFQMG